MKQQVLDQQILSQMQTALPHLPKALAKLTEFILANPQGVLFTSTSELSTSAEVGEATLIRLCRKFGFSGFQDFKLALAASLSGGQQVTGSHPALVETRDQQLLNETLHLVRQTMIVNSGQPIQAVTEVIRNSSNLIVFGVGPSSSIAREYAFRFLRSGIFAVAFEDVHEATLSLNVQRDKTTLLVLSISGQTSEAQRVLSIARERSLPNIAITTSAQSPVAQQAQHLLLTPLPNYTAASLGKIGQLLLLESITRELGS